MDFPTRDTADKNDAKPSLGAVTVAPPAFNGNDTRSAQDRFLDQQWRDLAVSDTPKVYPLSLNRDSSYIGNANDPYTA